MDYELRKTYLICRFWFGWQNGWTTKQSRGQVDFEHIAFVIQVNSSHTDLEQREGPGLHQWSLGFSASCYLVKSCMEVGAESRRGSLGNLRVQ